MEKIFQLRSLSAFCLFTFSLYSQGLNTDDIGMSGWVILTSLLHALLIYVTLSVLDNISISWVRRGVLISAILLILAHVAVFIRVLFNWHEQLEGLFYLAVFAPEVIVLCIAMLFWESD
ncbi:hypothetical protein OE749_07100 [Aestuariibacter sp. AA17]|uniref:Uncharacterized protein n=1 Tax=Fluctibacter corallii TaxID=2984329 RepID=A0ABT3A6Z1_9ALTE|nr:hypothetical protein [Aestuariibacter sp. AA17]MCV2884457.1 hypothetical protein [Aestuariibacter sp. AA17]